MFSKASGQGKPGSGPANIGSGVDGARPTPRSASPSIISSDLKILGDLISAGDLQVDGIVEGDIQSRSLTIGEGAVVKASTVTLDRTAKVVGDIIHQILAIEPGAFLEGHVRHSDPAGAGDSRRDGKNGSGS
jgi:cytoskeletal protein CcmA (bactofilin family)